MESVIVCKKYQYNIPKQVYNILYINENNIKSFLFRKDNTSILFDYKDNKLPYEIIKLINAITTDISIYAYIILLKIHVLNVLKHFYIINVVMEKNVQDVFVM